jgi:hypothetical protein
MAFVRTLCILVAALLAAGCALNEDSADHEAGTAVKSVLEQEYVGNYGGSWDRLHPRHQRLVSREDYDECRKSIDVEGTIQSVLILDVRDARLTTYGLRPRTPAKRVRVRVVTDESEYTDAYHVVRVGGEWRWVLSDRAARGFRRSPCPV